MSLDLANFSRNNNAGPTPNAREPQPEAKIWINFGYPKTFNDPETGEQRTSFVSLARGIPLDQVKEFDLSKERHAGMATLRRDQNKFRAALLAEAEKMEPGDSKIICFDDSTGLGVELKLVADAAAPLEDDDQPLQFSFR